MTKDLEKKFAERWPEWFQFHGSIQHTLIPFGLDCGDGWFDLLWKLCEDLEPMVERLNKTLLEKYPDGKSKFEVLQVKEKFGTLRFYTNFGSDEIWSRINDAEVESAETCEDCGQLAKPRVRRGWLVTLCDEHGKDYQILERETI